jgi:hypothetical protein
MQRVEGQMLLTVPAADCHPRLAYRLATRSILPPPALLARGGHTFRDRAGTWWSVYEYDCVSRRRGTGCCLVFESITVVRRVGHFPTDWRRLSAAELESLSWQT